LAQQRTSVGRLLLNDVLPEPYQLPEDVTKKVLNATMADFARTDPQRYVQAIGDLKRIGDQVATDMGLTVGLDDIEPDYARRDRVLEPALRRVKALSDPTAKRRLIISTQDKMFEMAPQHPGQMAIVATSGARGNAGQLMRTVTSPTGVTDAQGAVIPWMISKSFSEGLKPADTWIAMAEARRNVVESNIAVSGPGEMSKILVSNMSDQLVTVPDCGTTNGVSFAHTDPHIVGRYAASGGFLSAHHVSGLRRKEPKGSIIVRSPMTCEAPNGVCQKCYGQTPTGKDPQIGYNVGMIAAQAMGEPLTQMALSAKHATRTAKSQRAVLQGLSGLKQLTEMPQSFFNRATLAQEPGRVTAVREAPQGGHYVNVNEQEHYVPPNLDVTVKPGQRIEQGDALSDGIPKPDEVVQHKGLGAGRRYMVDQLHQIYTRNGLDLDKRHLELLAKTDLNYVKVLDADSPELGVARGEVVDYNRFRAAVAKKAKRRPTAQAQGQFLGDNVLHYTAGTEVTPSVMADLERSGVKNVPTLPHVPQHELILKPISRTPLLHSDWLARLGHRNLKASILDGATFGESSNIHGTHPVPAFVFGETLGRGPQGRY
jgi:hypothetical protein